MIEMIEKKFYSTMTRKMYDTKEEAVQAETQFTESVLLSIKRLRKSYIKNRELLRKNYDEMMSDLTDALKESHLSKSSPK